MENTGHEKKVTEQVSTGQEKKVTEQVSEVRKVRALSVSNLIKKKYTLLPLTGAWYDAFKEPLAYGSWFVYGGSGNGKTSFTQQMVKYMDEDLGKRVAYMSLEELGDHSMQQSVLRAGWREKGSHVKVLEEAYTPDEISEFLRRHKSPDVLVIDTVQYWQELCSFDFRRYLKLKRDHPKKLFIYLSHVDGVNPRGHLASKIMADAALKIYVQGYRAFSKGRYIGPTGYYSVWPEKEKEIWV